MYDEVMQLIALAKNDEQYFKRIEALKQQMLELAQVKEIAKTLAEADMHLASARQKADILLEEAKKEAEQIKESAVAIVSDSKATLQKAKDKKAELDRKETEYTEKLVSLKQKETELDKAISEHRTLTALRTEEQEKAQKVKNEFETKLRKLKEIANT